jgi:phosphate transport system substrate-binding protein
VRGPLGLAVFLAVLASVACAGPASSSPDPLAGTYTVRGGGAALDVFNALVEAFRAKHPTVRFVFDDVGSAAGMTLAASGDVDLATSSATPAPDIAATVTTVPVGSSATAIVVNATNPVRGLTKAQVRDVFSGAISDWGALGGPPGKIVVVVREATSAIRSNFDAYFFGGKGTYAPDALELNSGDEIIRAVSGRATTISMLTISAPMRAEPRIRALTIDGVAPTKENVVAGLYPVRRPLFLVYNEKRVRPAIRAFLELVRSPEGQRIIETVTSGE